MTENREANSETQSVPAAPGRVHTGPAEIAAKLILG
jgi:hypothetical protein